MLSLPSEFILFLDAFRHLFSASVFYSVQILVTGTILNCPHFRNYHNVLSRAKWSSLGAAKILFGLLVQTFVREGSSITIGIDETLERRSGKKIKAKGYYRDAVRSKGSHVVTCLGLEWLGLMLIVTVPWSSRPWALPFWILLQPSKTANDAASKPHKTSIDWTIQALKVLRRWEPLRQLILLVDGGFASFELLKACCQLHVTLICRLRIDAKLYEFPPPLVKGKRGPKPKKGPLLPSLKTLAPGSTQEWKQAQLHWYQEGGKQISYQSGIALIHKTKQLPIAVKWVLVKVEGKKTPQAFFSNNVELTELELLQKYMGRWNVEVTFEEVRAHLGVETQRQWSDLAIARTTPCLFALFSLNCCAATAFFQKGELSPNKSAWYQKQEVTFSDIIALTRRKIWASKYSYSEKTKQQKLFNLHDLELLILQLVKAA